MLNINFNDLKEVRHNIGITNQVILAHEYNYKRLFINCIEYLNNGHGGSPVFDVSIYREPYNGCKREPIKCFRYYNPRDYDRSNMERFEEKVNKEVNAYLNSMNG